MILGYFETEESLSAAQTKMAAKEINTRWPEFMHKTRSGPKLIPDEG
jgi:L-rhamnose mutarotase